MIEYSDNIKTKKPLIERLKSIDEKELKKKIKKKVPLTLWKIIRFLLILGIGFIVLYPLMYMFANSFKGEKDLTDPSVIWLAKRATFDNYIAAYKSINYLKALRTTVLVGVVSAIIQVFSTSFIGYGLARFKFRGKNILLLLVILSILVPPQITAIPTSINYTKINFFGLAPLLETLCESGLKLVGITKNLNFTNILNTPFTFYLPAIFGVGIRGGLFIFIFTQFYRNMPKDLEEAAMVDGCKPLQTYMRIMLPNAVVIFTTVFLFSLVWYWNDYFNAIVFYTQNRPLSVELNFLRNGLSTTMSSAGKPYIDSYMVDPSLVRNYLQAGALLIIAPIMMVYLVFQKYFVESIDRSGIVG